MLVRYDCHVELPARTSGFPLQVHISVMVVRQFQDSSTDILLVHPTSMKRQQNASQIAALILKLVPVKAASSSSGKGIYACPL